MGQSTKSGTNNGAGPGPRCIALVGPYLSGKTTLLEAILARTGAIDRQGKVADGTSIGDASPEARAHGMSVELNVATCDFLGDKYTFVDCPGSIEFQAEQIAVLPAVDAAVVVCEPDDKKIPALQLILKQLEERNIPHFLFLNKIDKAETRVRDMLEILQPASAKPLVLRQIPIWENEIATGFVDLALERAFVYREHAESEVISVPDQLSARQDEARFTMLEKLADYDDELMEQLLEDIEPPRDKVFEDLSAELSAGEIVPVLLGSAENGNGILRLLKALRHEAPGIAETAKRLGVENGDTIVQVIKTFHTTHGGQLSLSRILSGAINDGDTLYGAEGRGQRIAGLFSLMGQDPSKQQKAETGETIALGRLSDVTTGETLQSKKGESAQLVDLKIPAPVYQQAITATERKDEVKLTAAIGKIIEEDPSISLEHSLDTNEMVIRGQGDMHLRVALERLTGKYGVHAETHKARVAYKETIRKSTTQQGRHKKQSGGHGQFGDIVVDIKPLPRGAGFDFSDTISGGVVPKQYIPAVERGIKEYLSSGPLGFPVVDFAVVLTDGSYHAVDSSEQAFKTAGRIAISEGLPNCSPVLLEPVLNITVHIPNDATARINAIVAGRRGHLLGFDAREGWPGWDSVQAHMPASEVLDLIVEIRSATAGVGSFEQSFDHLAELTGKLAEQVMAEKSAKAA
ncbi:MAG: elongation factor G [Rhizobiales bacterium]|nr:elongation factor G [Hyphomicrobiales bacterium]